MITKNQIELPPEIVPDEEQDFALLPQNYYSANNPEELFYNEEIHTIKKMFHAEGIGDIVLKINENLINEYKGQKSGTLILPTVFITSMLLTENPKLVSIALSVIANYTSRMFRGIPLSEREVELKIIHKNKKTKKFSEIFYRGDVKGLHSLETILKDLNK